MKCIVTGAAGFIGSYLCFYLKSKGHNVVPLGRKLPQSFLNALQPEEWLEADVTSEQTPQLNAKADLIIHLASANEVVSRNVQAGLAVSVLGTKNMLDMAVHNGIPHFLFFSTLQVYGTEPVGRLIESGPVAPVNDYALNHLFAEHYVEMYTRKGLLRGAVIRPANVFGKFSAETVNRWTMVPACFCLEAVEQQTITIRSSGKQTRNFVSLENVSRAAEAVAVHFPDTYTVVHAASGRTVSIEEVALMTSHIYKELTGIEAVVCKTNAEPQASNVFSVSLEKLASFPGYAPDEKMTLETEIRGLLMSLLERDGQ
ncbi:NAD-dependent epimerase/dehydratase family protein [Paenibacillus protaetiae]|nr:NAD(P)-dependent oxidoreductase [Paenibacillus protaetiae]